MHPDQLRAFAAQLLSQVDSLGQQIDRMGKKNDRDQTITEQLTHEIAWFKRTKFAKRSEQLTGDFSLVSISASRRGGHENNMAFLYSNRVHLSSFVIGHERQVKR